MRVEAISLEGSAMTTDGIEPTVVRESPAAPLAPLCRFLPRKRVRDRRSAVPSTMEQSGTPRNVVIMTNSTRNANVATGERTLMIATATAGLTSLDGCDSLSTYVCQFPR